VIRPIIIIRLFFILIFAPSNRCLQAILADPFARAIFHPRHVAKSDRLRNGFETLKTREHIFTQEKYEQDIALYNIKYPAGAAKYDYTEAALYEDSD
jgi:hypothetical protein